MSEPITLFSAGGVILTAILFGGGSGAMWRAAGDGFNGFGPGINGQMWRSDQAGGFNGFGQGINGQMWRSDGAGGFNGF